MKLVHRIHRMAGGVFALWIAMWCISGALMTVVSFPAYEERERLASAPPLPRGIDVELPPSLLQHLERSGFVRGERPRLAMIEARPTWVSNDEAGVRRAWLTHAPWQVQELDSHRAAIEAQTRSKRDVFEVERMNSPDPWTVGLTGKRGTLPLYRVDLSGGHQVYVSPKSGEIVQESAQLERVLNWLGAVPHWAYLPALRSRRTLWAYTCVALATVGLVVSISGLLAGTRVWWLRRRKSIAHPIADPRLRAHHYIGLSFGVLLSTWLFSGALSVRPFGWTGDTDASVRTRQVFYGGRAREWKITAALSSCQQQLEVSELELVRFAGRAYAVCFDGGGHTRLADLDTAVTAERLGPDVFSTLARELGGHAEQYNEYDAYYFPRKDGAATSLPYWRFALHDARDSIVYADPARALLAQHLTRSARWERWLYHGLHSLDLPALYRHRAAWRAVVLGAMISGATLSLLGFAMRKRRQRRRRPK